MTKSTPRLAARFLEQVLLVNLGVHVIALIFMALFLLPGLPGGSTAEDAERIAYLATHPWLWRLGWLPWQLTAFMDLLAGLALWRTAWIPRRPAALVLIFTILAILPDQGGQALWVTRGLDLAVMADRSGDLTPYLDFERQTYHAIVAWGATLYLCMAIGWSWCFAVAGTWNRTLTVLSSVAWSVLAVGSAGLLLPEEFQPPPELVGACNGIGLTLLLCWLALVTEQVLRRARPDESHGRLAPWRHPWRGAVGRALDVLANSRLLRAYCEWLPPVAFMSDITDVIYVNYLVEAERLEPFVPAGLELQRIGRGSRYALFTHLTYRHGHFGPRLLGPLRRLLPSPVHTNWRIYVYDPHTGLPGVSFVTNAINSTPHALAARLLSEGMPMHALKDAIIQVNEHRNYRILLDAGAGSAPDMEAALRSGDALLPGAPWNECFDNYHALLAYCVPQDRAFSSQPWYGRITRQEIALGIPLDSCEPLAGDVYSRAAVVFIGEAVPLCFRVARVAFCFEREEYDPCVRESVALRLGVAQACLSLSPARRAGSPDEPSRPSAVPGDEP
ncbi:MAG TPA: DUF2071 domain-containing protein [Gemmataceae bacterium]|nr:DUF2071 domain-containing protein [Gemmataceae bacterium]